MALAVPAIKRPSIDLNMAISLNNRLSTQVSLTPQLQQAIRLLQLSNNELEQELAKAAEDNPLLEFEPNPEIESNLNPSNERIEVTQNNWSNTGNASQDDEDWVERYERVAHQQTLLEHLEEQIHLLNIPPQEQSILAYLAGCLDERGYLMDDLDSKGILTNLFADFWRPAFDRLRAINPDIALIAEQWDWQYGEDYLTRADTSAVFAFPIHEAIRSWDRTALVTAINRTGEVTPAGKAALISASSCSVVSRTKGLHTF
jgi:hypothetical protein